MTGAKNGRGFTGATTGSVRLTRKEREAIREKNESIAVHNELRLRFGLRLSASSLKELTLRVLASDGGKFLLGMDGPVRLELLAFKLGSELLSSCGITPSRDALRYAQTQANAKARRVRAQPAVQTQNKQDQPDPDRPVEQIPPWIKSGQPRHRTPAPTNIDRKAKISRSELKSSLSINAGNKKRLNPINVLSHICPHCAGAFESLTLHACSADPGYSGKSANRKMDSVGSTLNKCPKCERAINPDKAGVIAHFNEYHPKLALAMRRVLSRKQFKGVGS